MDSSHFFYLLQLVFLLLTLSHIFIDFSCNWMLFVEFSNLKFSVVEIKFYGYYIFVLVLICLIGNCGLALNVIYICILILTFS